MPSVQIDDHLWADFLQYSEQLGINNTGLLLAQGLRQRQGGARGKYPASPDPEAIRPVDQD